MFTKDWQKAWCSFEWYCMIQQCQINHIDCSKDFISKCKPVSADDSSANAWNFCYIDKQMKGICGKSVF